MVGGFTWSPPNPLRRPAKKPIARLAPIEAIEVIVQSAEAVASPEVASATTALFMAPHFVLYSKPGCHLCEGLQEKLQLVLPLISAQLGMDIGLELRDITTQPDWWQAYQYEIPVLFWVKDEQHPPILIARSSPRCSVSQLQNHLEPYWRA
jgi:hypothetical protein